MTRLQSYIVKTVVIFVLFVPCLLRAQDADIGKRKITIDALLESGNRAYQKYSHADSLLYYSKKAYDLSSKYRYKNGYYRSCLQIGIAYQALNEFDTSTYILKQLLKDSLSFHDKNLTGHCFYNLGLNSFRTGKNKIAVENYLKAIVLYESIPDHNSLALSYCKLAGVIINEQQNADALIYLSKAKALLTKVNQPFIKLSVFSGIAGLYVQLSVKNKGLIDSTILYSKKALEIVTNNQYFAKGSQLCLSLSNAYYLKEDYTTALDYCKQSLNYRKYLASGEIIITYFNFSNCYNALKQHDLAISYLDSAKAVIINLKDLYYEMALYERIYAYNKDAGRYREALEGMEKFKALQDSLYNLEKTTAINELMQKYNKVENEKKIMDLGRKNELSSFRVKLLLLGIFAALLIIFVIVFFYRQSVYKNRLVILETEQRLNRARINPHFFFNVLTSIKAMAENKERHADVPKFLSNFSKIMRQSLESTYDELVALETEEEFIRNYLLLQQIRYPGRFEFEIEFGSDIETSEIKIPGMLLQVFIENAIEHGFKNISYKGILKIKFEVHDEILLVTCIDNGVGLNQAEKKKTYPSRAVQIVEAQLSLLNKKYGTNSSLTIKEIQPHGVSVTLSLPLLS